MKNRFLAVLFTLSLFGFPFSPATAGEMNREALRNASVKSYGRLQVIRLEGTPYEMGYQHGFLLKEEVNDNVHSVLSSLAERFKIPWVGRKIVSYLLDTSYRQMKPFLPSDSLEELRGLADGSGVPLKDLQRFHAVPERFSFVGSSFVAYGEATQDSRLLQSRNLDWDLKMGFQRHPVLFVCNPTNKLAFVNIGFAGFIGSFSGLNRQGLSIAVIGAKSRDASLQGTPAPFLLRRVLEECYELKEAATVIRTSERTGGANYLFGDAVRQDVVVVETTRTLCSLFYHEDRSPLPDYGIALQQSMVRAQVALDPLIREQQTCANGDPGHPGLEVPAGMAHEVAYRRQASFVRDNHGGITPETAQLIAREVASPDTLQGVLYAYPEFWVSYAEGNVPASKTNSWHFQLEELF